MKTFKYIKDYNNKYIVYKNGKVVNLKKQKIINPYYDKRGRARISLCKNGGKNNILLHRLIAEYFIPNPQNKPYINHIDNNPSNNNILNLEWCTQKENMQHAAKQNRLNNNRKYDYSKIMDLYNSGLNKYQISKRVGTNFMTIKYIVDKHIK